MPFTPEPVEQMIERFQKALEREFNADKISNGDPDRPGVHRENVFDYEDGIRLIISKDRARGNLFIHISASSQKGNVGGKEMLKIMVQRFVVLNATPFAGLGEASASTGGVIHLIIPMGQMDQNDDPADSWKKA